jgi:dienelactone hydrolase
LGGENGRGWRRRGLGLLLFVQVLSSLGCARAFFHPTVSSLALWPESLGQVRLSHHGETLVFEPERAAQHVVVFLHGFAGRPQYHQHTLRAWAARGFVIVAPTQADYFPGKFWYRKALLEGGREAFDLAERLASERGLPKPGVVGFSIGGGIALALAAERGVPAVLWAPSPIDVRAERIREPVLILQAGSDCVVRGGSEAIAKALRGKATVTRLEGANHVGFTDMTGLEGFDCNGALGRDVQRRRIVEITAGFLESASGRYARAGAPEVREPPATAAGSGTGAGTGTGAR